MKIQHLCKAFDGKVVLDHVSLTLESGGTACLMAPSGRGKTTLLRCIAGLEAPDSGQITDLPERIAYVFQEDRLCDGFSAVDNIRLVTGKALGEGEIRRHLEELELLAAKEKQREGEETPEAFADNVIMYEVLSELKDIASRPQGITCGCGSEEYGMEIRRSAVDLICRRCGAKLRLPAATDRDLDDLCCHWKLRIPGKKD